MVKKNSKIQIVSKSDYAKLRGWKPSYVTKISRKGLTVEVDGKIDVAATDRRLAEAKDPARDPFRKKGKAMTPKSPRKAKGKSGEVTEDSTYHEARTERERWKAKASKLEYGRMEGKLVDVDQVRTEGFSQGRKVRDVIMNVPDRVSSILAAETDTRRVCDILRKALREAIEEVIHV